MSDWGDWADGALVPGRPDAEGLDPVTGRPWRRPDDTEVLGVAHLLTLRGSAKEVDAGEVATAAGLTLAEAEAALDRLVRSGRLAEHAPGLYSFSAAAAARPAARAWRPTGDGPLVDRERAELARLAESLGRWVEVLPDDDPRLVEAEVVRDLLRGQLRLPEPDRVHARRGVQTALRLLAAEARGWEGELAASAPPLAATLADVGTAAEAEDDEPWARAASAAHASFARLVVSLPDQALPAAGRDGLGDRLVQVARWAGDHAAAGVIGAGALAAGRAVLVALWNLLGI